MDIRRIILHLPELGHWYRNFYFGNKYIGYLYITYI